MTLPNGAYRTHAGSTMELSGNFGGISNISFDWTEEPHACIDCHVHSYPEKWGGEFRMIWSCKHCGGGSATLLSQDQQP